jgi:hypothetical protein
MKPGMITVPFHKGSISFWRVAAATTLLGLLLGVLGPFGSFLNDGFVLRVAYWVGAMWTGLLLYGAALVAADKATPEGSRLRWAVLVLAVLIASVPQAMLTRAVALRLWPKLNQVVPSLGAWGAQVVVIAMMMGMGFLFFRRFQNQQRPLSAPATARGPASVALSPHPTLLRGDIVALQMEDHYVRVHTPESSELILMPLARAIDMVAATDGLKTHRSWWVARAAVRRVEGTPRSMALRLSNGIVAPVARSAVASLRDAGWLDNR